MVSSFAIAAGLIVAVGVIFIVLRGDSSPRPLLRKRQIEAHQQRLEQARQTDADDEDDTRPGDEAIERWVDSN